jgi:hypothetical protein
LAELSIIVLGVLIALAVESWRQGQEERRIETEYLARLAADLEVNRGRIVGYQQFHSDVLANAEAVYPVIKGAVGSVRDTVDLIVHAYQATRHVIPDYVDDTFEELKSAGNLRLIRNQGIRMSLLAYYRVLQSEDYPFQLASREYRDSVRRLIDPDLQKRIREECELKPPHFDLTGAYSATVEIHEGNCTVALGDFDAAWFFERIHDNDELRGALALNIMQWTRGVSEVLAPALQHTDELHAMVFEELGRPMESPGPN